MWVGDDLTCIYFLYWETLNFQFSQVGGFKKYFSLSLIDPARKRFNFLAGGCLWRWNYNSFVPGFFAVPNPLRKLFRREIQWRRVKSGTCFAFFNSFEPSSLLTLITVLFQCYWASINIEEITTHATCYFARH
jgi:hypothetical protein